MYELSTTSTHFVYGDVIVKCTIISTFLSLVLKLFESLYTKYETQNLIFFK